MPVTKSSIQIHFASLSDPRTRKVTYPLIPFVVIAICAVICGADDFVGIVKFAKAKRSWLRKIVDLTKGIPSHDRFNAIFAAIKPAEFERQLAELDHGPSRSDQWSSDRNRWKDSARQLRQGK